MGVSRPSLFTESTETTAQVPLFLDCIQHKHWCLLSLHCTEIARQLDAEFNTICQMIIPSSSTLVCAILCKSSSLSDSYLELPPNMTTCTIVADFWIAVAECPHRFSTLPDSSSYKSNKNKNISLSPKRIGEPTKNIPHATQDADPIIYQRGSTMDRLPIPRFPTISNNNQCKMIQLGL